MMSKSLRRRRTRIAVASLALLAATSGCAQAAPGSIGPSTTQGPDPATYVPGDLVLRVELVHGFMPEYFVHHLPTISVYGDGRVITEGAETHQSPAMPNVVVRRITAAGVDALVNRAVSGGVGQDTDFGQPDIYDAPGTRFTVLTDRGVLVTDVYALGADDGRNLTDAQRSARQELKDLIDDLLDLPSTLGPDAGGEEPYVPSAMAVITRPWTNDGITSRTGRPERVWPGPALPGEPMGRLQGVHCLTVAGADVAAVADAAATADAYAAWTSGGQRWLVAVRPLLPDETSCTDLI